MLSAGKTVDTSHCTAAGNSSLEPEQDIFNEGREFLEHLGMFLMETAGLFRIGEDFRARESFVQVVEGLEFFVSLVNHITSGCGNDLREISAAGKTGEEHLENMNAVFLEMVACQENNDWVLLADLMEYEIVPQLQAWRELLTGIELK